MADLSRFFRIVFTCLALSSSTAWAGVTYTLDSSHASPGDTVAVTALVFNDSDSAMDWTPPQNLVLQWRGANGQLTRSMAELDGMRDQFNIPVNGFVKVRWHAIVPTDLHGLQAVNVEGEATLMALDTTPSFDGRIAGTVAAVPVVNAGAASGAEPADPPLPDNVVVAAGASPSQGPAATASPAQQGQVATLSGFDRFRNAISPYEPVYFVVGNRGGRHARYQVSFKYRLFTPNDANDTSFLNDLYLGYTQTALWDLHSESHPFIDTSYKPSVFWRKDALLQSDNKRWLLGMAAGVEHESNGKAGDDSRSVNHAYVQPELSYRFDGGSTITFAPRLKSYFRVADNRDYRDYAGNVDWKLRWEQNNGLTLTGLYRHGHKDRTMTQVDAAWPLRRTPLNMNGYLHLQYFKGYGETLLGYSHKSGSQFRIGLSFVP